MNDELTLPSSPAPRRRADWALVVPLAAHLVFAVLYALMLPLWGAVPDEPLHYSDIKYVAENWRLPVISDPFRDLKEYYFVADPAGAAQHGPTYYWSAAVLYRLTESCSLTQQQYLLRLYSVLLGLLTVYFTYRALELLFAPDRSLLLPGTLLVALMPHRLLMSAVLYADAMAILASTAALYAIIWCVRGDRDWRGWLLAGLVFGFDLLTKTSAIVLLPGLLLTALLLRRERLWTTQQLAGYAAAFALGAMALSGWWLVRSLRLYGALFPTEPMPPGYGWLDIVFDPVFPRLLWLAIRGYWLSIWSQVGWLPPAATRPLYGILLAGTALTAAGLVAGLWGRYRGLPARQWALLVGFAASGLTIFYAGLQRTLLVSFHSNEQTGKHAQTVLVAFVALAAASWRQLLGARRVVWVVTAAAGLMLVFNLASVYHLQTDLIPRFAPTPPPLADTPVRDLPRTVPWVKPWPTGPNRYLKENHPARGVSAPAPGAGAPREVRLAPSPAGTGRSASPARSAG